MSCDRATEWALQVHLGDERIIVKFWPVRRYMQGREDSGLGFG